MLGARWRADRSRARVFAAERCWRRSARSSPRAHPAHPHPPRPRRWCRGAGPPLARAAGLRPRARRPPPRRSRRKLIASATRLYGEQMGPLWGEIVPVPEENIRALAGGEDVLGFRVAYTPGHASHHVCFLHEASGRAFVGDVGATRIPPANLVIPPTPPPDIDLEAWERSLDLICRVAAHLAGDHPLRRDRGPVGAHRGGPPAPARAGTAGPRARRRAPTSASCAARSPSVMDAAPLPRRCSRRSSRSSSGQAWTATGASAPSRASRPGRPETNAPAAGPVMDGTHHCLRSTAGARQWVLPSMPPAAESSARDARARTAAASEASPGPDALSRPCHGWCRASGSSPRSLRGRGASPATGPVAGALWSKRGARCSRIRSTASAIASSGVVREIRKKPSPPAPYIEPGEITTAASSSTSSANEVEVWPAGTGAQT